MSVGYLVENKQIDFSHTGPAAGGTRVPEMPKTVLENRTLTLLEQTSF